MKLSHTALEGLLIIEPQIFPDERGYFYESYQQKKLTDAGLPVFVQDNVSRSYQNVLRGLHFQQPRAQGKLVGVIRGAVFDVAVDIRPQSKTFGQHLGFYLNDQNHLYLYLPPGFAHGFCVLSEVADFHYKCSDFYSPSAEKGIRWNDPTLNINWPIQQPLVAAKDAAHPLFQDVCKELNTDA